MFHLFPSAWRQNVAAPRLFPREARARHPGAQYSAPTERVPNPKASDENGIQSASAHPCRSEFLICREDRSLAAVLQSYRVPAAHMKEQNQGRSRDEPGSGGAGNESSRRAAAVVGMNRHTGQRRCRPDLKFHGQLRVGRERMRPAKPRPQICPPLPRP
jgi:hypothetical protein